MYQGARNAASPHKTGTAYEHGTLHRTHMKKRSCRGQMRCFSDFGLGTQPNSGGQMSVSHNFEIDGCENWVYQKDVINLTKLLPLQS